MKAFLLFLLFPLFCVGQTTTGVVSTSALPYAYNQGSLTVGSKIIYPAYRLTVEGNQQVLGNIFANGERVNGTGGEALFSGNGTTVTFAIPHGLGYKPTKYTALAGSDDVGMIKKVTADATNIYVTLVIAPPTGTNNVTIPWTAR